VERGRERQQQRSLDAQPALQGQGREDPEPLTADRQVERAQVDPAERIARAQEDDRECGQEKWSGDECSAREAQRPKLREDRQADEDDPGETELEVRTDRQEREREDRRDDEDELQTGVVRVDRRGARDRAVEIQLSLPRANEQAAEQPHESEDDGHADESSQDRRDRTIDARNCVVRQEVERVRQPAVEEAGVVCDTLQAVGVARGEE
jgi:hypothetical protein